MKFDGEVTLVLVIGKVTIDVEMVGDCEAGLDNNVSCDLPKPDGGSEAIVARGATLAKLDHS